MYSPQIRTGTTHALTIKKKGTGQTDPKIEDDELPPENAIIIEGHFQTKSTNGSSAQKNQKHNTT
jgi:hypothetical protein